MSPPTFRQSRISHGCSWAACVVAVVVPCGVLVGWMLHVEWLKRIVPGLVAMNPLTAVSFILCGLALTVLRHENAAPARQRAARLGAWIVVLAAAHTLAGIAFDFALRLDCLLFHAQLELDPVHPNRMAPTAAVSFILLGAALLLLDAESPRRQRPSQWSALVVTLISALALLGYFYGVKSLTGIAHYIPMAMHTAFVFIALACGILAARSDRGWMARFTGAGAGGVMARRYLSAIIGAPLLLGWLSLAGQRAGFYNVEFAQSLLVISVIVVFSALIWTNAVSLDRRESERVRADEALRRAHEELEQRVEARTAELSAVMREIGEGIEILGESAKGIVASTAHLAESAANTASALIETTTTVQELRQTAGVANATAQEVASSAQAAADISQAGERATEEVRRGMQHIREQMQAIADSMLRLNEKTQTIGEIVATVEELSQQSNLLAVNAAIEAAKAGLEGKGFSVVAQEVKFLADQSKAATAKVRTILRDIQSAATAAAKITEEGTTAVEAGVGQSGKASGSIFALAESVGRSAEAARQIAETSQQQLVGIGQVVLAMNQIQEASTRNGDNARQLESSARKLNDLGEKLRAFAKGNRE